MSRDKQGFLEWRERQRVFRGGGGGEGRDSSPSNPSDVVDLGLTHGLTRAVQASQYGLLTSLRVLYPVQNPTQVQPTMRWVTLPSLERACSNSREETALSVTLGWVAHVLCTVSALLDVSLRYPIVYRGSQTVILDPSKGDGRDQVSCSFLTVSTSSNAMVFFSLSLFLCRSFPSSPEGWRLPAPTTPSSC